MCYVDLEPCKVWQERDRTARKRHRCDGCRGPILPGETYTAHFSVFEGRALSEKMCGGCDADRSEFAVAHEGMLCTPGDLRNMIRECMGESEDDDERKKWQAMLDRIKSRGAAGDPVA
jgi:hypothetical protein